MQFDFNELRELLTVLNQTDIAELTLKSDDFELTVRKGGQVSGAPLSSGVVRAGEVGSSPELMSSPALMTVSTPSSDTTTSTRIDVSATASAPATAGSPNQKLLEVSSPMVGTFYRSPAPDEPSFVDVGDRIRVGQTVCIIEAMKLMNELETEVAGEIVEILVQNGDPVEYGQILMRVNPA